MEFVRISNRRLALWGPGRDEPDAGFPWPGTVLFPPFRRLPAGVSPHKGFRSICGNFLASPGDALGGSPPLLKPSGSPKERSIPPRQRSRAMRFPGPSFPLLLLGCCLLGASTARKNRDSPRGAAESVSGAAGGSSGRFSSPEQHACSWQILLPAPGAAEGAGAGSELAVSCQGPDGSRYQCAYRGEPQRCAAYNARGPQYWKQVVGKLRKKRRPCHDPAPLKARLCGGKKGLGAELQLSPRPLDAAGAGPGPAATLLLAEGKGKGRGRARGQGRAREPAPGAEEALGPPRAPPPSGAPAKEKGSGRKGHGGKRKETPPSDQERPMEAGPAPGGPLEFNEELTETYCAEKWHSLCNFFVNFWNG
ncbi:fibroblast growth factor-binding protein 3 [Macrotis lagotis]|uniref:fibroblast growth factor-binding protein 3 n=1 Tax=Macrotis lagotis TaxID=92651 RepID=UPI003D69B737